MHYEEKTRMSLATMETLAKSDNSSISVSSSLHSIKKLKNWKWKLNRYKLQRNGNLYLKQDNCICDALYLYTVFFCISPQNTMNHRNHAHMLCKHKSHLY